MIKLIYTHLFLINVLFCLGQEPGWSGFSFKLYDKNNKPVSTKDIKSKRVKILLTPVEKFRNCKERDYKSLKPDSFVVDHTKDLSNKLMLFGGYNEVEKEYNYQMWLAPIIDCSPLFIIIMDKDTMFVRKGEIRCNPKSKYGNEGCSPFKIKFKKGYYDESKLKKGYNDETKELYTEKELKELFKTELSFYFCYWMDVAPPQPTR